VAVCKACKRSFNRAAWSGLTPAVLPEVKNKCKPLCLKLFIILVLYIVV